MGQPLSKQLYVTHVLSDPVHNTTEQFENAALFLRLGLPSTLIRHENEAFRKRPSNQRNLKTLALRFFLDRKHFENDVVTTTRVISLTELSKMTGSVAALITCFCLVLSAASIVFKGNLKKKKKKKKKISKTLVLVFQISRASPS